MTDNDDSYINEMSTLLLSGATMLADSCPTCNVPLFKQNDTIFCPKCKRKAVYVSSDKEASEVESKEELSSTINTLIDILNGKLKFLSNLLVTSEEVSEITKITITIMKIAETIHKLQLITSKEK